MTHMKLTINGQEIEVLKGTTILEAAKSAGIYIPTLCYHPDLPPARGHKASKVAIVGSGPAGLTATFYLKKQGGMRSQFLMLGARPVA